MFHRYYFIFVHHSFTTYKSHYKSRIPLRSKVPRTTAPWLRPSHAAWRRRFFATENASLKVIQLHPTLDRSRALVLGNWVRYRSRWRMSQRAMRP